mgnify:CR=1 FL=1
MARLDLTRHIERLEAFEDRAGVRLESLSAYVDLDSESPHILRVYGELHAKDGTELPCDVTLVIAAYDDQGRVVGSTTNWYDKKDFFGLDVFEILFLVENESIRKVRIFPKRRD